MSEISTQKPIRETASRTIRTLRPADTDYPPMLRDISRSAALSVCHRRYQPATAKSVGGGRLPQVQ